MPTIFTKIINGDIPGDFVYRDDLVVAFRDINPQARVHILIVPIKEIRNIQEVTAEDEAILGRMLHVARIVAEQESIAESGYRLLINNGQTLIKKYSTCTCTYWVAKHWSLAR
jgi:histidine triad (HIT) family protein